MVTIATHQRRQILAAVVDGRMVPTRAGRIAHRAWQVLPDHFPNIEVDRFVAMPDHVHGILRIHSWSGPRFITPHAGPRVEPESLGAIVRSFKSAVTRAVRIERPDHGPVWQRNYWERVLRGQGGVLSAQRYVEQNPAVWIRDHGQ